MKNKNKLFYLIVTMISMGIAIYFALRLENKISNLEYTIDNSNLESNIAIMVLDLETKEYLKSNSIPIGKYILNIEKTNCVGRGLVSDYNNKTGTIKFKAEAADECYVYFDAYSGAYDKIITEYTGQGMTVGNGKLYLHNSSLANSARDGSYRYAGTDPDNYLCFEGDTCDDNHKYRIIGIFGENVKVIKMTNIGNKVWNSNSSNNIWDGSTMDTYLNGDWLAKEFGHGDLIENYNWHVGGSGSNQMTSKTMYDTEMKSTPVVNRKVGLMYANDYGFAAENTYWSKNLINYDSEAKNTVWMYTKTEEWTISRYSANIYDAFTVHSGGIINIYGAIGQGRMTRPCFYLKPSVEIKSGSGTKTDPWIIGI